MSLAPIRKKGLKPQGIYRTEGRRVVVKREWDPFLISSPKIVVVLLLGIFPLLLLMLLLLLFATLLALIIAIPLALGMALFLGVYLWRLRKGLEKSTEERREYW